MNSLCPCHNTHIEKTKDIYGKLFKHSAYETKEEVSCTDCHKPALDGLSFKAVREYCIECHNCDYGLLYDAWKETLDSKIKHLYENDRNAIPMRNLLKLVQSYGMHNIRLSQKFLMNHG